MSTAAVNSVMLIECITVANFGRTRALPLPGGLLMIVLQSARHLRDQSYNILASGLFLDAVR